MTDLSNIEVFTVLEVNSRMPLLSRIMHDLREAWTRRRGVLGRLRHFRRAGARACSVEVAETIRNLEDQERQLEAEVTALEHEIHQLGGIVKDPGRGVVNFFSQRDGSLVFLSWMLGEDEVHYWHDLEAGLGERQRLTENPDLSPTSE